MALSKRLNVIFPWLAPVKPDAAKAGQRLPGLAGLLLLTATGPVLAATDPMAEARQRMVETQLKAPDRHITHPGVLKAMGEAPRHEFVPEAQRALAYADRPVSIGHGQTISQPYVVAFMTEQLDPRPTDKVLEIGTGSGYQAAVLSPLVNTVYTVEIVEALGQRAMADLRRLGYDNVQVRIGDGFRGWSEAAPFDAIIVTCAPDRVPPPLIEQLKEGGRLVIPVGPVLEQTLYLFTKRAGTLERRAVLPVRFVPMTGEAQRQ